MLSLSRTALAIPRTLRSIMTESIQSTPGCNTPVAPPPSSEAGPSNSSNPIRQSVIDKWLKPDGPPRGVSFGARKLGDADDVWSNNAWWASSSS